MTFRDGQATWRAALLLAGLLPATLLGQVRGVVVDQTGLPLPGAHVDVHRADRLVTSLDTALDGGFELPDVQPGDIIAVSLDGFDTMSVAPADAQRVVLPIAHTTMTTEVVASALTSAGASMEHLGSSMTAPLAQRLPTARPRILQSLPLMPGVVRGRDGQISIGGTRAHESVLWVDGFDVTDPVRGFTGIDLPVEAVRGMAVLREPVSALFGDVLGSAASVETTPGSDQMVAGLQGFIPRPRLNQFGFGRIEAFFPRAYVGGRSGTTRYFTSAEFNFERVPVPGVTGSSGAPSVGTNGITSFSRFDFQPSTRHSLTAEALLSSSIVTNVGLSTLQPEEAAPDVKLSDIFGALTSRHVISNRDVVTIRAGVLRHGTSIAQTGNAAPTLTPDGWANNWFSTVDISGAREMLSATWERAGTVASGNHSTSLIGNMQRRSMSGSVVDLLIRIVDDFDHVVRLTQFTPAGSLSVSEVIGGLGARDLWDVTRRLQLDFGFRLDGGGASEALAPAPRFGMRYLLDDAGRTTLRGSAGRYVGRVPLAAKAFAGFPSRVDTSYDARGAAVRIAGYRPELAPLSLPRADAVALEVEHKLTTSLEVQTAVRARHGSRLPTVDVPVAGGVMLLSDAGESQYYEFQVAARKVWENNQQMFLSYVRSSSTGEFNDFGSLFSNLDAPVLEPGGTAPTSVDVPHRFRGWATFSLPRESVLSPAVEWRTGFPYSIRDGFQRYAETPNSRRFPAYFSVDVTAFKTFEIWGRKADLGIQVFNITNHDNPRDVISVLTSQRFQEFHNGFPITLAGYMQVRW